MPSAWGKSFGAAWGNSWGFVAQPPQPPVYIPQMQAYALPMRDWVQIPKKKVRRSRRDEILFLTH